MDNKKLIYTTLDGEKLDLSELNADHKCLLKEIYDIYQKVQYSDLYNTVFETDHLKRMGAKKHSDDRYYIDKEVHEYLICAVVIDLVERKAIQEGLLGLGENSNDDFSGNKKVLEDFLE